MMEKVEKGDKARMMKWMVALGWTDLMDLRWMDLGWMDLGQMDLGWIDLGLMDLGRMDLVLE